MHRPVLVCSVWTLQAFMFVRQESALLRYPEPPANRLGLWAARLHVLRSDPGVILARPAGPEMACYMVSGRHHPIPKPPAAVLRTPCPAGY